MIELVKDFYAGVAQPSEGGGGGSGGVTSVNGQTGAVTLTASDLGALQNTATASNSLAILGTAGNGTSTTVIGQGASVTQGSSTAVGAGSKAFNSYCVSYGYGARCDYERGIAIGANTRSNAYGAIQIGYGDNAELGTFYVGLPTAVGIPNFKNYKLLESTGLIPAARLGTLPTANGNYTLRLTITNGVPTLSWVAV